MLCKSMTCERDSWCKGYCSKHYYHAQRHGLLPRPKCSVVDCSQPSFRHGYCNKHNLRFERYGDPSVVRRVGNGERKSLVCIVKECGKPCRGPDYCSTHYRRWKRHGDPFVKKKLANGEATEERKKENTARAMKTYQQTPHGKMRGRFNSAKRRILAGATTDRYISKEKFLEIWKQDVCALCGSGVTDKDKSLDHIIPLSRGGSNSLSNIQIAHSVCNQRKSNTIQLTA